MGGLGGAVDGNLTELGPDRDVAGCWKGQKGHGLDFEERDLIEGTKLTFRASIARLGKHPPGVGVRGLVSRHRVASAAGELGRDHPGGPERRKKWLTAKEAADRPLEMQMADGVVQSLAPSDRAGGKIGLKNLQNVAHLAKEERGPTQLDRLTILKPRSRTDLGLKIGDDSPSEFRRVGLDFECDFQLIGGARSSG